MGDRLHGWPQTLASLVSVLFAMWLGRSAHEETNQFPQVLNLGWTCDLLWWNRIWWKGWCSKPRLWRLSLKPRILQWQQAQACLMKHERYVAQSPTAAANTQLHPEAGLPSQDKAHPSWDKKHCLAESKTKKSINLEGLGNTAKGHDTHPDEIFFFT